MIPADRIVDIFTLDVAAVEAQQGRVLVLHLAENKNRNTLVRDTTVGIVILLLVPKDN